MSRVVISHRTASHTGLLQRLVGNLEGKYPNLEFALGVDSLVDPGDDYVEAISEKVSSCDVLFVIIDDTWLSSDWLEDDDDYDMLAIKAAIDEKIRLIPILCEGAEKPSKDALPKHFQTISRRGTIDLSEQNFKTDVANIAEVIDQYVSTDSQEADDLETVEGVIVDPITSQPINTSMPLTPAPIPQPQKPAVVPVNDGSNHSALAQLGGVVTPNMIKYVDPKGRARISSTSKWVDVLIAPGFGNTVITRAQNRKRYPIIGRDASGQWWQIMVDGIPGWVADSSIKRSKFENVQVTRVIDGGVPSAQEIYFLHALAEKREKIKSRSHFQNQIFVFGQHFLKETKWADNNNLRLPQNQIDPEFLRPAEGGVGMYERKIARQHPIYKRMNILVWGAFIILLMISIGDLSVTTGDEYRQPACSYELPSGECSRYSTYQTELNEAGTDIQLRALGFLGLSGLIVIGWMVFWGIQGSAMNHTKYRTKGQGIELNRELLKGAAAAAAVAGVAGVALAGSNSKNKGGSGGNWAGNLEKLGKGIGAATPALGALAGAYAVNKMANPEIESDSTETEMLAAVTGHTFISYRRQDASQESEQLYNALTSRLGKGAIFRDIEEIPGGQDFRTVLHQSLANCKVVIALMGRDWATLTDNDGNIRIKSKDDYVRAELRYAFKYGIPVIPVVVDLSYMPSVKQLPDELKQLAYLNARTLNEIDKITNDIINIVNSSLNLMQNSE